MWWLFCEDGPAGVGLGNWGPVGVGWFDLSAFWTCAVLALLFPLVMAILSAFEREPRVSLIPPALVGLGLGVLLLSFLGWLWDDTAGKVYGTHLGPLLFFVYFLSLVCTGVLGYWAWSVVRRCRMRGWFLRPGPPDVEFVYDAVAWPGSGSSLESEFSHTLNVHSR